MAKISFMKRSDVLTRLAISKTTLRSRIQDGLFPPAVVIVGSHVWPCVECEMILDAHLQGKSELAIRELVGEILKARKNGGTYDEII